MNIKAGIILALCVLIAPMVLAAQAGPGTTKKQQYLIFVGTYTTNKTSKGIYAYRFDAAIGRFTSLGLAAEATDPSFLAVHPSGKYLYAVNEIGDFNGAKSGAVSAFAIEAKSGTLKLLNQAATRGAGPCHLSLDKNGKFVLVANYDGGSVATFPVGDDGSLGPAAATFGIERGQGAARRAPCTLDRDFAGQTLCAGRRPGTGSCAGV